MCAYTQEWACNLSQRGSKGPHLQEICRKHQCHVDKREQREKRDETENRGSHSTPGHCYFKLFSSNWGRGEQCTTHTLTRRAHWEQLSLLFKKRQERKKKSKSREVRTSRDGVKDIDTGGDEVAYQKKLYSSLPPTLLFHECDAKHASTRHELEATLLSSMFSFSTSYMCLLCSQHLREVKENWQLIAKREINYGKSTKELEETIFLLSSEWKYILYKDLDMNILAFSPVVGGKNASVVYLTAHGMIDQVAKRPESW